MIIKCTDISKYYKTKNNQTKVFEKVGFEIQSGDLVALIGRSGSGKSTLLNILGFLDTPCSGSYIFKGKNIDFKNAKKLNQLRRDNISYIRQDYGLIKEYNVHRNIGLPLKYKKDIDIDIDFEIERVAKILDIEDKLSKFPEELSGGECQRVAIARAIITNPKIIIADEPTGSLDIENEKNVMEIFRDINKMGTTIIVATHNMDIANECNTRLSIQEGKIRELK